KNIDDDDMDGDGVNIWDDPNDLDPFSNNTDIDGDGILNGADADFESNLGNTGNPFGNSSGNSVLGSSGSVAYTGDSAIEGNVYVDNLDGVEGSLEAIREGLSQRLDLNLSDIGEKI
ncbi:hypothetical protein P4E94_19895, partial [Pontiellaceae bacterium B12219]|nr:hypothetical protein [Pontiellaceae bacterium B12219]